MEQGHSWENKLHTHTHTHYVIQGSLVAHLIKNPSANTGDRLQCRRPSFDPWVRKIPWRRKWQPLQHSCLENPMDRGAGGLQSMGSQRVRHDLATKQQQHAYTRIHTHTLLVLFLWKTLRHWQSFTSRSKLDLSREAHNKIHHTVASGCP